MYFLVQWLTELTQNHQKFEFMFCIIGRISISQINEIQWQSVCVCVWGGGGGGAFRYLKLTKSSGRVFVCVGGGGGGGGFVVHFFGEK